MLDDAGRALRTSKSIFDSHPRAYFVFSVRRTYQLAVANTRLGQFVLTALVTYAHIPLGEPIKPRVVCRPKERKRIRLRLLVHCCNCIVTSKARSCTNLSAARQAKWVFAYAVTYALDELVKFAKDGSLDRIHFAWKIEVPDATHNFKDQEFNCDSSRRLFVNFDH